MAKGEPSIIVIKGISPGVALPYWQPSYGDILANYPLIDLDADDQFDHLWNMRN